MHPFWLQYLADIVRYWSLTKKSPPVRQTSPDVAVRLSSSLLLAYRSR